MAICDYCGISYRGGAIKDGAYRYCTGVCLERGKALLSLLNRIPQDKIDALIKSEHAGPCPRCGENRSIDVYTSYQIWSALVYSRWQTKQYVACQQCARQQQVSDLGLCLSTGWWSPIGFLITPFFVIFNLAGLLRRQNPAVPSDRFRKLTRLHLARHLANRP
jgi:hypothetical protein